MSETQLIWFLATGFLLFFIAIGLLVIRLLSWFGWSKYLPAFAWDRPIPPDARRFSWASMFIGRFPGGVSYRNAMNIWIDARGLYLRPLKFFSLFHPPLHIGWDAIANLEPRKTLWIQVYHISFRRDVPMLTFGGRAGRAIFDAWHSYGGGQRA